MKKTSVIVTAVLALLCLSAGVWAKWEQEQVLMESSLQERIERLLTKTLEPSSFLVTVKVELADRVRASSKSTAQSSANPFLDSRKFVLPGVPAKKGFSENTSTPESAAATPPTNLEALVKKITVTILVAPDTTPQQIAAIRELVMTAITLVPGRGDALEIRPSSLIKPNAPKAPSQTSPVAAPATNTPAASTAKTPEPSFINRLPLAWIGIALVILLALAVFLLAFFLFGPMRAFLERLLAVLPRIGEQAAYAVSNTPPASTPSAPASPAVVFSGTNGNGNGSHAKEDRPFSFILESELPKLPVLFKELSPAEAAVILAYLPPEWASRVLNQLDSVTQTSLLRDLSKARELPAEAVQSIELQLKQKLPYLVGGIDWVQSVYQLTQPSVQRTLLGALSQDSPEMAQMLRNKTVFFEDLVNVSAGALRALVLEVGYAVMAQALKGEEGQAFQSILFERLPAAMRDIVQQEVEMAKPEPNAIQDAKTRVLIVARRMLLEGRLTINRAA